MWKRVVAAGAVVGLSVGGWTLASRWDKHRLAACEQRSTRLSALDVLNRRPDGFQPDSSLAAGCDVDRVVAYASRQFLAVGGPPGDALNGRATPASVDEPAVTAFYRQVLADGAWQVSARKPGPGPNAAGLCGSKDLPFGRAYVNLSFLDAGSYEMTVADTADAGTTPCA